VRKKTCQVQRGHGRCCDLDPRLSPSICSFCSTDRRPCCVAKKIKSAFISGKNRQEQQRGSRKGKPGESPLTCHASCLKRCLTEKIYTWESTYCMCTLLSFVIAQLAPYPLPSKTKLMHWCETKKHWEKY
jgi:hypothetical protein